MQQANDFPAMLREYMQRVRGIWLMMKAEAALFWSRLRLGGPWSAAASRCSFSAIPSAPLRPYARVSATSLGAFGGWCSTCDTGTRNASPTQPIYLRSSTL